MLIVAYTVPAIFISLNLTGNPLPQLGLGANMADGSGMTMLGKLNLVITELGFPNYTTQTMAGRFDMFVYTMSLMIGTA